MILLTAWLSDQVAGQGLFETVEAAKAYVERSYPDLEWNRGEYKNGTWYMEARLYTPDGKSIGDFWEITDIPVGQLSPLDEMFGKRD